LDIIGKIQSLKYTHALENKKFNEYNLLNLKEAFENDSSFMLNIDEINKFAVSWWVSSKRTCSYPYARVYDTLTYTGKRITVIPVYKDEGKDGDRDFLQWDTISLMSLLGVNVIIAYYTNAEKNIKYKNKITNQRFDIEHVSSEIKRHVSYQSDPLHWNLEQVDNIVDLSKKAVEAYKKISEKTKVIMHSEKNILEKINFLTQSKENFMLSSRKLSREAQKREIVTLQPKENINTGEKSTVTISNYLGGYYYFTADEARIFNNSILLVEAKHSSNSSIPSIDDIKDGLIKMILFSNVKKAAAQEKEYNVVPILKLTGINSNLSERQITVLNSLKKEAEANGFFVEYNGGVI